MALTIIRQHIPSGQSFEFDGLQVTAGSAPTNTIGEGNLSEVFQAAADSWEQAIQDDHTVTIQFGWSPHWAGEFTTSVHRAGHPTE